MIQQAGVDPDVAAAAHALVTAAFHAPPGAWTATSPTAHPATLPDVIASVCRDVVRPQECVRIVQEAVQDDVALHHELCVGETAVLRSNLALTPLLVPACGGGAAGPKAPLRPTAATPPLHTNPVVLANASRPPSALSTTALLAVAILPLLLVAGILWAGAQFASQGPASRAAPVSTPALTTRPLPRLSP